MIPTLKLHWGIATTDRRGGQSARVGQPPPQRKGELASGQEVGEDDLSRTDSESTRQISR
jgi:hypothetical protein